MDTLSDKKFHRDRVVWLRKLFQKKLKFACVLLYKKNGSSSMLWKVNGTSILGELLGPFSESGKADVRFKSCALT